MSACLRLLRPHIPFRSHPTYLNLSPSVHQPWQESFPPNYCSNQWKKTVCLTFCINNWLFDMWCWWQMKHSVHCTVNSLYNFRCQLCLLWYLDFFEFKSTFCDVYSKLCMRVRRCVCVFYKLFIQCPDKQRSCQHFYITECNIILKHGLYTLRHTQRKER